MFASTLSIPAASPAGFLRNSPVPSRRRAASAVVRPRAVAAVERRSARSTSSLYEVLRIDPKATMTEIKTAYRSLAKVYHPDLAVTASSSSSDGSDFIEIHNAYETLSDPAARAVYDSSLFGNGRRRTASFAYSGLGGFNPTRRWETDQCW